MSAALLLALSSQLSVAAASDLKFAMEDLRADFQKRHPGVTLEVSYGASGNFFAQLRQQAPFDLFLSADADYPRKLEADGHALPGSYFLYGVGRLVLWAPRSSGVDPAQGLKALLSPAIKRIAIANPRHAPYGRAAEAALRHAGVYEQVRSKLVLGENVAQAAQFAQSGAADAAIVGHSLALAPAMEQAGRYWELPRQSYPRLEQAGLILKWARDPSAAKAFRDYLLAPEGRRILERWGLVLGNE